MQRIGKFMRRVLICKFKFSSVMRVQAAPSPHRRFEGSTNPVKLCVYKRQPPFAVRPPPTPRQRVYQALALACYGQARRGKAAMSISTCIGCRECSIREQLCGAAAVVHMQCVHHRACHTSYWVPRANWYAVLEESEGSVVQIKQHTNAIVLVEN
jgi:hypothetical protein